MLHIYNRENLVTSILATIAGAVSMLVIIAQFSEIFGGMSNDRDLQHGINGLLVVAGVMPIISMIIHMAISRSREYEPTKLVPVTKVLVNL